MIAYIIVFTICATIGAVVARVIRRYEYDSAIASCEAAIRTIRLYEALNRAAEYEDAPKEEHLIIDTPNLAEGYINEEGEK